MTAADFELHELVLRHLKGILKAYESWLTRKKAEANPTTAQVREGRPELKK